MQAKYPPKKNRSPGLFFFLQPFFLRKPEYQKSGKK